jgi:hypothetical protein
MVHHPITLAPENHSRGQGRAAKIFALFPSSGKDLFVLPGQWPAGHSHRVAE